MCDAHRLGRRPAAQQPEREACVERVARAHLVHDVDRPLGRDDARLATHAQDGSRRSDTQDRVACAAGADRGVPPPASARRTGPTLLGAAKDPVRLGQDLGKCRARIGRLSHSAARRARSTTKARAFGETAIVIPVEALRVAIDSPLYARHCHRCSTEVSARRAPLASHADAVSRVAPRRAAPLAL
jgi:hypothetical protein